MLRFLMLALLFIIITSCNEASQSENSADIKLEAPKKSVNLGQSIEEITNSMLEVKCYHDILSIVGERNFKNQTIIKKLDFGAQLIQEDVFTNNQLVVNLKYLVYKDQLAYGIIHTIDSSYHILARDILFYSNKSLIQKYTHAHKQFYERAYTKGQLIDELFTNPMQIRIACGNASSSYGVTEIKLFKAVANKQLNFIHRMLTSVSPERQVLGFIGAQKMIDIGENITPEMLDLKKHIMDKNPLIAACASCTHGVYTLTDYLSKYKWEQIPNIDLE